MKKIEDCIINNAVLIALLMVVVVIFSYVLNFQSQFISEDANKWGVFGDFIGGTLNPFLSFLALIILLRTFSMQRNELKDTQRILQTQNATRIKQNFESTFFSLLNVHNQILAEFSALPAQDNTKFDGIAKEVEIKWQTYSNKSNLRKTLSNTNYDYDETPLKEITSLDTAYKKLIDSVIYYGNYFHILSELLRFIKMNAPLEYEISYSRITRSMLTNDVLQLLAIYCYKDDEYRLLLERYAIFENASFNPKSVDDDEFPAVLEAVRFYDSKIFGL